MTSFKNIILKKKIESTVLISVVFYVNYEPTCIVATIEYFSNSQMITYMTNTSIYLFRCL